MTPSDKPLIALIHGVPTAMDPAVEAVRSEMPGARIWNILDDRLIEEVHARGSVTPELRHRMTRLIDHALREGADGVLITCSLYSFVADAVPSNEVPVIGADTAGIRTVVAADPERVLLVGSVPEAVADSVTRLLDESVAQDKRVDVVPIVVPAARQAARVGDLAALTDLLVSAITAELRAGDVVLFAQYSLAPAGPVVEHRLATTVYTGPARAASELRAAIDRRAVLTTHSRRLTTTE